MPDPNNACNECGHAFPESEATTVTDYEDDMYDRPSTPFAILACPKCLNTDVDWDLGVSG